MSASVTSYVHETPHKLRAVFKATQMARRTSLENPTSFWTFAPIRPRRGVAIPDQKAGCVPHRPLSLLAGTTDFCRLFYIHWRLWVSVSRFAGKADVPCNFTLHSLSVTGNTKSKWQLMDPAHFCVDNVWVMLLWRAATWVTLDDRCNDRQWRWIWTGLGYLGLDAP